MNLQDKALQEIDELRESARAAISKRQVECAAADELCAWAREAWANDSGILKCIYSAFPTEFGSVRCPCVSATGYDSFYDAIPLLAMAEELLGPCYESSDVVEVRTRRYIWRTKEGRSRFMIMIELSSMAECEIVQVGSTPIRALRCM